MDKEFKIYLNGIAEKLSYSEYKSIWRLMENPNDIEALHYLCVSIEDAELTEEFYKWIGNMLDDAIHNPDNDVKEIDSYEEKYPGNPVYEGYEINGFEFITAYTGEAGKHWNTICKW